MTDWVLRSARYQAQLKGLNSWPVGLLPWAAEGGLGGSCSLPVPFPGLSPPSHGSRRTAGASSCQPSTTSSTARLRYSSTPAPPTATTGACGACISSLRRTGWTEVTSQRPSGEPGSVWELGSSTKAGSTPKGESFPSVPTSQGQGVPRLQNSHGQGTWTGLAQIQVQNDDQVRLDCCLAV